MMPSFPIPMHDVLPIFCTLVAATICVTSPPTRPAKKSRPKRLPVARMIGTLISVLALLVASGLGAVLFLFCFALF